ncbi:unnamed protein product [Symbiodinium sp. CCMP2592]|nr:unnamed protein product [Symbiodinium sp. CCMP2592]
MGGKKWQAYDGWQHPQQPRQPPWHLWPGSRPSASPRAGRRYDHVQVPSKGAGKHAMPEVDHLGTGSMLRDVQKALTNAKRADGKIRRLLDAKEKRAKQWEIYEKETKEEFYKNKQLFESDVERLNGEIQATKAQGKEAAEMAWTIVRNGPQGSQSSSAQDTAWEELLQRPDEAPTGFFKEAMDAARRAHEGREDHVEPGRGGLLSPEDAARFWQHMVANAPPGLFTGTAGDVPMPPESSNLTHTEREEDAVKATEPYMPSPSTRTPDWPLERGPSPGQKKGAVRTPIKGAAIHPYHVDASGPGLADKLMERRQAMQPFGIPPNNTDRKELPNTRGPVDLTSTGGPTVGTSPGSPTQSTAGAHKHAGMQGLDGMG